MKARDYFEKYDTLIMEEQKTAKLAQPKNCCWKCPKWNAICRMYEKKYGVSPLNYDAFRCYWMTAMPELAGKL